MVPFLIVDTASPIAGHTQRTDGFSVRVQVVETCLVSDRGALCSGALSRPLVIRKQPDGRVVIEF